jgi:hypothetical protein
MYCFFLQYKNKMNEIFRAYYILFSDDNIHKVLKDRFA